MFILIVTMCGVFSLFGDYECKVTSTTTFSQLETCEMMAKMVTGITNSGRPRVGECVKDTE